MSPTPAPLLFCLRVPEFAAQALVRLRPALRQAPVAILQGEPPLERCCAATLRARQLGVRHGMTRTELESLPGLTLLRRSIAEETSAADALLEMAARFTPSIEELPRTSAFTFALNMSGCDRLFGPPHTIGNKLLRAVRELGLHARAAGSANLHTAACLVRAPGDTLIVVPPGEERTRLQPLPLPALDLSPELAETLTSWGLRSIGELAALSPVELIARLGQEGHHLLRLARGEAPHLFVPVAPAFSLREHLAFDTPVDNLDSLLFVLGPMLDQLITRARAHALLLASLTVRLHLERSADAADRHLQSHAPSPSAQTTGTQTPGAPSSPTASPSVTVGPTEDPVHERTLKPALPLDNRTHLLKLLHLDLQAHPAPAAIVAITLAAEPGERPGVQSGLFAPQLPEALPLEITLARIVALVGEGRVGHPQLTDTHHTENFRVDRLTVLHDQPTTQETSRTGIALRRLRPPRLVHVWQQDGRLSAFALRNPAEARFQVQRAFGPWRRSGHWWSGAAWSHEEWDIDAQATDGTRLLCLLTHNLLNPQWRMEALYD